MIIKCYNEKHPYLLFLDLEFNNQDLVQFAGVLFRWIDEETYQLYRSYNVYINQKVCYPFAEYTSITNNFLAENGIPLADAIYGIEHDFLEGVPLNQLLLVSHGLKNDRLVLDRAGVQINTYGEDKHPVDGYCTFTNGRRILGRTNHLTLGDIASECGYYLHHAHNAYNDTWAEVAVFTYLKKKEKEQKESEND